MKMLFKFKLHFIGLLFFCGALKAQLLDQHNWRASEKDSLTTVLNLINEHQLSKAFPSIQILYKHHSQEDFLKYTFAKCALEFENKQDEAFQILNDILNKNPNTNDIYYYMAKANYHLEQFDEALYYTNVFLNNSPAYELISKAENLKKYIHNARNNTANTSLAKVQLMSKSFNNEGNQIFPVMNYQASKLFFTNGFETASKLINQSLHTQLGKVQQSISIDEQFKSPELIKNWNEKDYGRIVCISTDEKSIFLIKDNCGQNDIFISTLNGNTFSKPKKLKGPVNSLFNENACCLAPDGKTLFFSSNRSGGFGGYDLYRATLNEDSVWTQIVNLGTNINTNQNEDAPFIHVNGKSLFFSSEGFDSMGGFDVFKSELNVFSNSFTKAENLMCPINSIGDDVGFVISANGEEAFMASNRRGGSGQMDLYHLNPNFENFKPSFCIVKGKVNLNQAPAMAKLSVENLHSAKLYSELYSNANTGEYVVVLPVGERFQMNAWIRNFQVKSVELDLRNKSGIVELTENIAFSSYSDSLMMSDVAPLASSKTETKNLKTNSNKKINTKKDVSSELAMVNTTEALLDVSSASKSKSKKETINKNVKVNESNEEQLEHFQTFATHGNSIGMFNRVPLKDDEIKESKNNIWRKTDANESVSLDSKIELNRNNIQITDSAELADRQAFMLWLNEGENKKTEDEFKPKNEAQQRILDCFIKNGSVREEGLVFKIQIAANKENSNKKFYKLQHLGKVEQMDFHDDFIRYTIGGEFKSYGEAFEFGKKVIEAGHNGIYIFGIKDGKRYKVEDLVEEGIFR